jgi:hypothetical protein
LKTDDNEEADVTLDQTLKVVLNSVLERLCGFKEQELNNLAHDCDRLCRSEHEMFAGMAGKFHNETVDSLDRTLGRPFGRLPQQNTSIRTPLRTYCQDLRLDVVDNWKPQESAIRHGRLELPRQSTFNSDVKHKLCWCSPLRRWTMQKI